MEKAPTASSVHLPHMLEYVSSRGEELFRVWPRKGATDLTRPVCLTTTIESTSSQLLTTEQTEKDEARRRPRDSQTSPRATGPVGYYSLV